MALILTPLSGIPRIAEGDDLAEIALEAAARSGIEFLDGDILVVAQKIVSKAEGRLVDLAGIQPSEDARRLALVSGKDPRLVELILQESREVIRVRPALIIVEHRLGFICANAGIDRSNVDNNLGRDCVLLLPADPDSSAEQVRATLREATGSEAGVLIIDSHGRAWRLGTTGAAIGVAGLPAIVDLRGESDLFGYRLENTIVGAADELASAASLVMGQAAEGTPMVHVRGFPYALRESSIRELIRPVELDLFR
jgi:coenzyme F420-0:L-glutamate ligase/coenzyme F420-1:gamma-L-glutamate ligase